MWSSILALLCLSLTCTMWLLTLLTPVGYCNLWQDPISQAIQRIEHHQMMQQQEMLHSITSQQQTTTLQQQAIQRIEAKLAKQEEIQNHAVHTLNEWHQTLSKNISLHLSIPNSLKNAYFSVAFPTYSSPNMNFDGVFWSRLVTRLLPFLRQQKRRWVSS